MPAFDSEGRRIIAFVIPAISLAAVGAAVYFVLACLFSWRIYIRHRGLEQRRFGSFLWPANFGCICMCIGFLIRIGFHFKYDSLGIYIVTTLFILLSPCLFLWATYRTIGELGAALGENVSKQCLVLRAQLICRIFVAADITTFWIQAVGGGISASANVAEVGKAIALVGLCLQLASVSFFTLLVFIFGLRVRSRFPAIWAEKYRYNWRILWVAILLACCGYLVRSAFRVAEYSQGYDGYLAVHEGYLYTLDSLPLALALLVFIVIWPPLYTVRTPAEDELSSMSEPEMKPVENMQRFSA